MATSNLTMEVEIGPVCRSALDVLDLVRELLPDIPLDDPRRNDLADRALGLVEFMKASLGVREPR